MNILSTLRFLSIGICLFSMTRDFLGAEEECGSTLQIGGDYTYANLKVHGQPNFYGSLGGAQGIYEYRPSNGLYGALRAAWKEGQLKNSASHRLLIDVDVEERLGYTCSTTCQDASCTLFWGFGYHFLSHKLTSPDSSSLKFYYNEFYVPVGFLSDYFFTPCFSIGFYAEWMPQVFSTVEIVPLKGARWVLQETLGNVLLEVPFTFIFGKEGAYSVLLKPFYEHWQDGASTARTFSGSALDLPRNDYNFVGVDLNVAFSF